MAVIPLPQQQHPTPAGDELVQNVPIGDRPAASVPKPAGLTEGTGTPQVAKPAAPSTVEDRLTALEKDVSDLKGLRKRLDDAGIVREFAARG